MNEPLPRGLSEQLARTIGIRIVSGDVREGERFENEDILCEEFGVSRTVVREAMKRLSAKGLVQIRPRLGTSVLSRTRWSLLDPDVMDWCRIGKPSLEVLLELREMRAVLEPGAAALACQRANEEDVKEIWRAYKRMEVNVNNAEGFAKADADFHVAILRATHNDYLIALGGLISADLLSSIKVTNPDSDKNIKSLVFHLEVVQAIAGHDKYKAKEAMGVLLDDAGEKLRLSGS
ncbi:FadR/GntR family transcriptional regulator [Kiloniella sp. EL199]|uniref:FadR/GntR family transcriptional regulator n=1 Tax=Kiloniella sp. EL199 TaxID=2107581 RepID=UPI0013C46F6C|nr:FadR/GntR family transcriptional regulator [Kiloniella sp. EL199]